MYTDYCSDTYLFVLILAQDPRFTHELGKAQTEASRMVTAGKRKLPPQGESPHQTS